MNRPDPIRMKRISQTTKQVLEMIAHLRRAEVFDITEDFAAGTVSAHHQTSKVVVLTGTQNRRTGLWTVDHSKALWV